ncbi:unnamed protein product [Orchesella dallaii]|uniref:Uncharacterized protein n=1 Tax=Orchesella dallaii TaxID=48710 RepID=A0ABP1R694_9HEXA
MAENSIGVKESTTVIQKRISLDTLNSFNEEIEYYLGDGFDNARDDVVKDENLMVMDIHGYNRTHYFHGEEIVPLDLDFMIQDLYITGHLDLGTNRLTTMLGNPEYGKRELRHSKYPTFFTVEAVTLDLRIDDLNGFRTAKVLERIRFERIAGLWIIVDKKCLAAIKELSKWLNEHGKCIISFTFIMFCEFKSCQLILPALLVRMPNLKVLAIFPMCESIPIDSMAKGNYYGQGYLCPKLKEIKLYRPYLSNDSFLLLLAMLYKGCLEKCGNGQMITQINENVQTFYKRQFGITFVDVEDPTQSFMVNTTHHVSNKKCLKFFLKFGHFPAI